MYSTLNIYGQSHTATSKHYSCPSLAITTPIPHNTPTYNEAMLNNVSLIKEHLYPSPNDSSLLPVMDPNFNLREICKQSILLEDHLSHDQKRCTDCCTKHFLALEALAEEAITLDTNNTCADIKPLPRMIRELELLWIQNPVQNSHKIAQKLRIIRKQFQQKCFNVIQQENVSCKNGECSVL